MRSKNNLKTFNVCCIGISNSSTSFIVLERDYQTLWLKLDSLGMRKIKINEITA